MRRPLASVLWAAVIAISGCTLSSQQPPARWTTGFWFWHGSDADAARPVEPLDVLYVHAGNIEKDELFVRDGGGARWSAWGNLPEHLPGAREYWLVYRYDRLGLPDPSTAAMVSADFSRLRAAARDRGIAFVGVQLDIDCPTGSLPQFASYLQHVRKSLPRGVELSITALLDWFRPATDIAQVLREVDEFVPQFYDIAERDRSGGQAIAAKIDAARWGPVFNAYKKRFRVGISSFGRSRVVPRTEPPLYPAYGGVASFREPSPLQLAANSAFQLRAIRNPAGELVLTYRAARRTRIDYHDFAPGDAFEFILATPEAIRDALENVRKMGGHAAGVLFFRWPSSNEDLSMQPDDVLAAASGSAQSRKPRVHFVDGRCAAVFCADIYLDGADALSARPLRYRIRASAPLEYFLPEENMPARMSGRNELEVSLPPYTARALLYLGRAVTATTSEFSVEEMP